MLSISQFSKIAHITSKTLRYYDEIDLVKPALTDPENGYRYYEVDQLVTIFTIQKLKKYECSLDEIKTILEDPTSLRSLLEIKKRLIEKKRLEYSTIQKAMETDITALAEGGTIMLMNEMNTIELTESPEFFLLSVRKTINVRESGKLLQEVFTKITTEKLTPTAPPMFFYHSPEYTPENYDVEVAVPVKEEVFATRVLQPLKCAKLTYIGLYEEMAQAYIQLTEWLEKNNYLLSDSPFEIYLTDPAVTEPEKNEVAVYFPIKENV